MVGVGVVVGVVIAAVAVDLEVLMTPTTAIFLLLLSLSSFQFPPLWCLYYCTLSATTFTSAASCLCMLNQSFDHLHFIALNLRFNIMKCSITNLLILFITIFITLYWRHYVYGLQMNSKKKEVREDIGLHIAESSLDVTYALMQQLVPGIDITN